MDRAYADTVRLLLTVTPDVFANDIFAIKGSTGINLFVYNMPRLPADIDEVHLVTRRLHSALLFAVRLRINPTTPKP